MTKGCYTCRRRRIVCDNGLPTCRKCRDAGKECLGYQKPLVWVKGGVASRGKMMGLSFDDVMENTNHEHRDRSPLAGDLNSQYQQDLLLVTARDHKGEAKHDLSNDDGLETGMVGIHEAENSTPWLSSSALPISMATRNEGDQSIVRIHEGQEALEMSPPWGLVDPLFQDMGLLSRFYVFHFNQRCAPDLALYDAVKNPYRDLIPFIKESPVLTDSLAAVGAIHYAYVSSNDRNLSKPIGAASQLFGTLLPHQDIRHANPFSVSRLTDSKSYEHFLALKQRALRHLSIDLLDPIQRNDDRTVAAILVLILLDAMESGSGAWKFHLEGAKNLLKSRPTTSNNQGMREMIEGLDTFVIDSCLVMEIMGATLARPGALSKPFYSHTMGPAVLKRLEKTSWVGCPAYLLEVIFFVNALRYSDTNLSTEYSSLFPPTSLDLEKSSHLQSPTVILQHIEAFDPVAWAEEMQTFLFLCDLSKRLALASAYKAAVSLYARRVLSKLTLNTGSSGSLPDSVDDDALVNELIFHLSLIDPQDEHFKCTIWLTFIAGAESKYAPQRIFTLAKLDALWNAISSVNVQNAAWVLKIMWQGQDERKRHVLDAARQSCTLEDDNDFDWIQELDRSSMDWLFI
ncbi:hypothetical protein Egran_03864 [Elaphomyces granulatus]|uniref:Zn(2)-C6 fungal-type domain-containing protein n=1 Tax=Elaphomyces granulatus TaxID=519963 RepID=A0A232LW81_9EURO|nr:hypothetical protein Egran_03864 [Elaphomyces granulatus]